MIVVQVVITVQASVPVVPNNARTVQAIYVPVVVTVSVALVETVGVQTAICAATVQQFVFVVKPATSVQAFALNVTKNVPPVSHLQFVVTAVYV